MALIYDKNAKSASKHRRGNLRCHLFPARSYSIVFDRFDNAYISLAFTGEIRKAAVAVNIF